MKSLHGSRLCPLGPSSTWHLLEIVIYMPHCIIYYSGDVHCMQPPSIYEHRR